VFQCRLRSAPFHNRTQLELGKNIPLHRPPISIKPRFDLFELSELGRLSAAVINGMTSSLYPPIERIWNSATHPEANIDRILSRGLTYAIGRRGRRG
jgi:hypothetical protein